MRVFGDEIRFTENTFYLCGDNCNEITVSVNETFYAKLRWLLESGCDTVLDYEDEDFEIFFGPYIMRDTTGYVIQVIDRKTRDVITSRYPFGIIHLEDIKRDLRRVYNG